MPDISEVIFEVKNKQAIADINKMKKSLDSTSKSAQGLVSILLQGWSASKLLQTVQSVAQKFEDVKVTASTFKKVFKDSMDSANSGVKNLIENFNETERSAQKLLNTIGGRLSNLGLNPQELSQYSSELARIAQELTAAGLGSGLQQNAKKLSQGLMGEVGGLKDLGILINTTSEQFKNQVQALKQSKGISEELARAQIVYGEVLKQTAQYSGTFAQKSGDLNQALGDIKNTLDSGLFAKMGQNLSKVLTPLLQMVNSVLSMPIIQEFGAWIGTITAIVVPLLLVKSLFGKISSIIWNKLSAGTERALKNFSQIGRISANVFKNLTRNTQSLAEKTLLISKAWKEAYHIQKQVLEQEKKANRHNIYQGAWTGKKTAYKSFDKWIHGEWKLGSDEVKTINYKAKLVSTSLLDELAYQMTESSIGFVHKLGVILNLAFQTSVIPAVTSAFSKSKILSATFLGLAESTKFLVQNLAEGRNNFKAGAAALSATLSQFGKNILTQFNLIFTSLAAALKTFSFNVKYTAAQMIEGLGLTNAAKKVGTKLKSGFATMFVSLGLFFKSSIAKLGSGIATAIGEFSKTVAGVATGIVSAKGFIAAAAGFTLAAAWDTLFEDGARTRTLAEKLYNWWEDIISWFTGEQTTAEMKASAEKKAAQVEAAAQKRRDEFWNLQKQQSEWIQKLKDGFSDDTITKQMAENAKLKIQEYSTTLQHMKKEIQDSYDALSKQIQKTKDPYGSQAQVAQKQFQQKKDAYNRLQNKVTEYKQLLDKYNSQEKALEDQRMRAERQRLDTIKKNLEANDRLLQQNLKFTELHKQLQNQVADLTDDPSSQEKIKRFSQTLKELQRQMKLFFFKRSDMNGKVLEQGWKLTASKFEQMKKREADLIIDIAKTRIEALKNQQSALSKFREFVVNIWAKVSEFKNRGAEAIIAGTAESQNFINSYSKDAGLSAYFSNTKRQGEMIQKQILKIQTDTEQNVQKIYKELLKTKGAQNAVYISAVTAV